jgi:sugar/nucleoside kinase (ribokinase family)
MSLLVTGSIGIDTVKTPYGFKKDGIGGSAVHFSMAASFFGPVNFVGVIGNDCPFDLVEVFKGRDVDLRGLEVRSQSKTFRWAGTYKDDMNDRTTDNIELNVLAEEPPAVPDAYRDSDYIFLANTAPSLQLQLIEQLDSPKFIAADTMNHWIVTAVDDLKELLDRIDMLVLNDGEAKLLTGHLNLMTAAQNILELGPKVVIIKKGEHGSMMCNQNGDTFILPAFPTEVVIDPTGAGDSFAGALMGHLAKTDTIDFVSMRMAMVYGTVASSFAISDFAVHGISAVDMADIEERVDILRKVTQF